MARIGQTSHNFLDSLVGKQVSFSRMDCDDQDRGTLIAFDEFTIIIRCGDLQVMYYKHAIASIREA